MTLCGANVARLEGQNIVLCGGRIQPELLTVLLIFSMLMQSRVSKENEIQSVMERINILTLILALLF
jgi:hypothetical protein